MIRTFALPVRGTDFIFLVAPSRVLSALIYRQITHYGHFIFFSHYKHHAAISVTWPVPSAAEASGQVRHTDSGCARCDRQGK